MTHSTRFALLVCVLSAGCLATVPAAPQVQRRIAETYRVAAGSLVSVRISGGPISVEVGPAGTVGVTLEQRIEAGSDAAADTLLADYEVSSVQQGDVVTLTARRKAGSEGYRTRNSGVRFDARLTVPPNVRLDLDTSGGSISVLGDRQADLKADTSGGSITVDGGQATMDLDTSGGNIQVRRALSVLRADTSGGGITVDYVGASATDVSVDTSGGSIRVGVDAAAKLNVDASTSGGSVTIEGLPFTTQSVRGSRASGSLNGGGGRLNANTSGGSIAIRAAQR